MREVSDEQIEEAIKKFARDRGNAIQRLTFDSGPYEVTEATRRALDFARAILALASPPPAPGHDAVSTGGENG